ncbi:MAG TPA: TolC family protein, partial [Chitinophagaceae bacterium]|nr:TolC family protein [Chitinophagaceae bacterium]
MINMKRTLLATLFIFIFLSIKAQVITLEEAISTALKNNYDIQLGRIDSASAALDRSYVFAAFIPQFNAVIGKNFNSSEQKAKLQNGTDRNASGVKSNTLTAAVNMNWLLFDGLRMFATKEKVEQLEVLGGLNVKNTIAESLASLINTYYNIVQAKQSLKATEEQMTISSERVTLADKKLAVGLGTKQELLQAQLDLNAQKAARIRQLTSIDQLKQLLNQLMAVDPKTYYDVLDTIPINMDMTLEDALNSAHTNNPSILIARKNIDIANLTLKENRGDYYPTISFNSAYNFREFNNSTVVGPGDVLFSQNKGLNYGFTASIPILNNFNTRRLVRQAKLGIQSAEVAFSSQQLQVELAIYYAFKSYEFQKQSLQLEESNIQLAKENVTIAFERFRLGVSTYIELREAQISLADAYNRLIAARYNTKVAETALLRL